MQRHRDGDVAGRRPGWITDAAIVRLSVNPSRRKRHPTGLSHKTTIRTEVRNISVLLDPSLVREPGNRARILAVAPVIKEMMAFAVRWPILRAGSDQFVDQYCEVFWRLVSTRSTRRPR